MKKEEERVANISPSPPKTTLWRSQNPLGLTEAERIEFYETHTNTLNKIFNLCSAQNWESPKSLTPYGKDMFVFLCYYYSKVYPNRVRFPTTQLL